jgi:hypothetical protein
MSVVANMSVAKTCSCQWLILHGSECVDIRDRNIICAERQITQHIRCGLSPLPFGTLPSATPHMLETLYEMAVRYILNQTHN